MCLNITFYVHCLFVLLIKQTGLRNHYVLCVCVLHLSAFEIGEGYSRNLLRILCHSSTLKHGILYVYTISYRQMAEVKTFEV